MIQVDIKEHQKTRALERRLKNEFKGHDCRTLSDGNSGNLDNKIMDWIYGGFLGEIIVIDLIGGILTDGNYQYDILKKDGTRIEVKTKLGKTQPLDNICFDIKASFANQDCDIYLFTFINYKNWDKGWVVGFITPEKYRAVRVLREKGYVRKYTKKHSMTFKEPHWEIHRKHLIEFTPEHIRKENPNG